MQLKAMPGKYPSESELESILDQPLRRTYGDLYIEPTLKLPLEHPAQRQLTST